ncbi:MAG: polyprenyl diphosphate synthase [Candidatus Micrarchaeia archaeon]
MNKKIDTIAVIPDGNRRWGRSHLVSISNVYTLGIKKFLDFSEWCYNYGIRNIVVWGLSTENIGRSSEELDALFSAYIGFLDDVKTFKRLKEKKARLILVGNRTLLPKTLLASFERLERQTKDFSERKVFALFGYGGKDDIMHAAYSIAKSALGKKRMIRINENSFKRHLQSNDVPDIDLVIRTSGELRLSGFMSWQTAYSELYFCKKYWPAFTKRDLDVALSDYFKRERRFGI